jgi:hypothetical protein
VFHHSFENVRYAVATLLLTTLTSKSSPLPRVLDMKILSQLGVGVFVGVRVMVGVRVIVGVRVMVGVCVMVGVLVGVG